MILSVHDSLYCARRSIGRTYWLSGVFQKEDLISDFLCMFSTTTVDDNSNSQCDSDMLKCGFHTGVNVQLLDLKAVILKSIVLVSSPHTRYIQSTPTSQPTNSSLPLPESQQTLWSRSLSNSTMSNSDVLMPLHVVPYKRKDETVEVSWLVAPELC